MGLRSNLSKACGVPGSTEGLFLVLPCLEQDIDEYLLPFVLRIIDSDGVRLRVDSAECVDKLTRKILISKPHRW